VPDTGGPGRFRGGASVAKDSLWLTAAEHFSMTFHMKRISGIGACGGAHGRRAGVWMWNPDAAFGEREPHLLPTDGDVYAASTPVTGVFDPETKQLSDDGEYFYWARVPSWQT